MGEFVYKNTVCGLLSPLAMSAIWALCCWRTRTLICLELLHYNIKNTRAAPLALSIVVVVVVAPLAFLSSGFWLGCCRVVWWMMMCGRCAGMCERMDNPANHREHSPNAVINSRFQYLGARRRAAAATPQTHRSFGPNAFCYHNTTRLVQCLLQCPFVCRGLYLQNNANSRFDCVALDARHFVVVAASGGL